MADILIGNVKGPQGVQGDPGEQGVQGEAATIEVGTVSTTAYGNPAQVTNSGTAEEAVFDFVIPAGRPGEETTSMSALTLDTITAQTAAFPVPAVGERGAVVFGKIIKFFTDTVSSLANKLNISDVVNNLTSTATNKPLSAAQGKALNDALSNTNTNVSGLATKTNGSLSGSGTASFTITDGKYVRVGNVVVCSVRGTFTGSSSTGTQIPLVALPYKPIGSSTIQGPSFITIGSSMFASGVAFVESSGTYYAREAVTSTLTSGTIINMFFVYMTDGTAN